MSRKATRFGMERRDRGRAWRFPRSGCSRRGHRFARSHRNAPRMPNVRCWKSSREGFFESVIGVVNSQWRFGATWLHCMAKLVWSKQFRLMGCTYIVVELLFPFLEASVLRYCHGYQQYGQGLKPYTNIYQIDKFVSCNIMSCSLNLLLLFFFHYTLALSLTIYCV